MRIALIAALTLLLALPAAAQRSRAPSGFDFNTCFSQCLTRGGSPGSCQTGCSDRANEIARIPPGARAGNNDPRSPNYYNPPPRQGFY
jgi:hypothetical protein